ncbi:hypothetical protein C8R45DRAFT_1113855 [Mycena sanguinolenta]|nr:hypothetical protein C8R45DRAFT_1113855 [Mycena sanguinolenta]
MNTNPNPPTAPKPPSKSKKKDMSLVESRLASIREACSKKQPTVISQYKEFVIENRPADPATVENAAFVQVLCGYALVGDTENASAAACQAGLSDLLGGANIDLDNAIKAAEAPGPSEGRRNWLIRAHCNINSHGSNTFALTAIHRIYLVLTSIEFSLAWNAQNDPEKDLSAKALFIDQHQKRKDFDGMSPVAASKAVDDGYANEYKQWRKKFGRDELTPRNKLAEVYAHTGLHMLLDPFWNVDQLVEGRLTLEWVSIWAALREEQPTNDDNVRLPLAQYEANRAAAMGVLRALNPKLATFARTVFRRTKTNATTQREDERREEP